VARPWSFGRPAPLSPAQRARIESVNAQFARSLEVQFATLLQQPVQIAVAGSETVLGAELTAGLESPGATFAVRVAGGGDATGVLELGSDLALALVERLLGGPGLPAERRALTAFEQALVRGIADRALALLADSWSAVMPTALEILAFETDPALLRIAAGEPLLAVYLELNMGGERRDLAVALPVASLGARLRGGDEAAAAAASQERIENRLRHAHADVSVRFPEFRLTARALLGLTAGQVVHTQHPADAPFDVLVNGRVRHRGVLGQLRRRLGVRVREAVPEPESAVAAPVREGRIL
jgi:flagellar motor switch protein FliM